MNKKLLIAVVLLLTTMLLSFPVTAANTPSNSIPSANNVFNLNGTEYKVVRTADDFLAMKEATNYILANDIDFANATFTTYPVVLAAGAVIEGNGCAIYGFSIEGPANVAPFGLSVGNVITIRNITVGQPDKHVSIVSTGSGKAVGGIISDLKLAEVNIENCTVYADLNCKTGNVGGAIGLILGNKTQNVKGFSFYGTATGKFAGGVIGQQQILSTIISDSNNYGSIIASTVDGVAGGIIGKCFAINNSDAITGCANFGNIEATNSYAGGLFGWYNSATYGLIVSNFFSAGRINGNDSGGVIGYVTSGCPFISLEKCTNIGIVNGKTSGGMIGNAEGASSLIIKESLSHGRVTGETTGIIVGKAVETSITTENNSYMITTGANTMGTQNGTEKTTNEAVSQLQTLYTNLVFTTGTGDYLGYPVIMKEHVCVWDTGEECDHAVGCPDGKAKLHRCLVPGCTETWLEYKEHTRKEVILEEADCENPGKKQIVCEECNYFIKEETIPALGHNWSEWTEIRPATVDQEGEQQRTCSICGKIETKSTPKLVPETTKPETTVAPSTSAVPPTTKAIEEKGCGKSGVILTGIQIVLILGSAITFTVIKKH